MALLLSLTLFTSSLWLSGITHWYNLENTGTMYLHLIQTYYYILQAVLMTELIF